MKQPRQRILREGSAGLSAPYQLHFFLAKEASNVTPTLNTVKGGGLMSFEEMCQRAILDAVHAVPAERPPR